jgi:predicted pyridoxine 5'-phosphate oxidase superfamily flavin-nucleotide-binding protein
MTSIAPGSVFHAGEQAVQSRVGLRERIEQIGAHIIRDVMPEQHRELFQQLPMLIVGSLDERDRPWASLLVGRPGFIHAPDPRSLRIAAQPLPGDPLAASLQVGAPLGLLGIELETRRRNRMNGRVVDADADGFTVRVQQSFGNCPKYIQARAPRWLAEPETFVAPRPLRRETGALSDEARAIIRRADTFFIATATPHAAGLESSAAHGVDVSHRGGRPGFVRVSEEASGTALTIPDFTGNFLFNTLGNLMLNPRAGLLFLDFESGDLLGLTGAVEVLWDGPEVQAFAGAERLLRFRVEAGWGARNAVPLRWSQPELSPHLAGLGPWHDA